MRLRQILAVLGALAALISPVFAQELPLWGYGKPVCAQSTYKTTPKVLSDGSGGTILVWLDYRNGSYRSSTGWSGSDVFAQRIDSDGNLLWQSGGVSVCVASGEQYQICAVADGAGGVTVAWTDGRGAYSDLFAQRLNSSGQPLWTANGVPVCNAQYDQFEPVIVSDGAGGSILAWRDLRNATWDSNKKLWVNCDVYAQKLNSLGQAQWTSNGVSVCTASLDQDAPQMIQESGGAIIAWYDYRNGSWDSLSKSWVNADVYAQKLNSSGQAQWTANGAAVCIALKDEYIPTIASDGAGGAIIAWMDCRVALTDPNIYAQRIGSGGAAVWTANGIPICTAGYEQFIGSTVSDGTGGAFIIWTDYRADSGGDIYAQRVDGSGNLWTQDLPLAASSNTEYNPLAASDASGNAVIAYQSWTSTTGCDVMVQKVDRYQHLLYGSSGLAACNQAANQQNQSFCFSSPTGIFFTWDDDRYGSPTGGYTADIYVQLFGATPVYNSVSAARAVSEGTTLTLTGEVVTGKFNGVSYIQDSNGLAGIKVLETTWPLPAAGESVQVTGAVWTVDGERRLDPLLQPLDLGPGTMPGPCAIAACNAGGGPVKVGSEVRVPGLAGGIGANNVGLRVRLLGRVGYLSAYDDPEWPYFYLDDGSGALDPSGNIGIKVYGDAEAYGQGSFLSVTGISSTWLPSGQIQASPAIRATSILP